MNIPSANLPTHISQVCRRLHLCHEEDLTNRFLETSYLAEVCIKSIGIILLAGLRQPNPSLAYRHSYDLVRPDGLGSWEVSIRNITNQPNAAYLPAEFNKLLGWLTKKRTKPEDERFRSAYDSMRLVLRELGAEDQESPRNLTVRDIIAGLVQIRNKTKAHGAVGQDFYERSNVRYLSALSSIVETCPAFAWRWLHISLRESGKCRMIQLTGFEPRHLKDSETGAISFKEQGVHIVPDQTMSAFYCGDLLHVNRDCTNFSLPNGGHSQNGFSEFIDYGSGKTSKFDVSTFLLPPAPLPASETEGMSVLDVQSNVFGNLPPPPARYVQREILEAELNERLFDKNHAIITLHGGGGMGKTSLAVVACHKLSHLSDPPFEHIVWFSARDIDLRPAGPAAVKPAVVDIQDVASRFIALFSLTDGGSHIESFSKVLQSPSSISDKGILFVFDNFETMSDVRELHKFLDLHTHLPNKVLITSRERAFKADYPIEVKGMESDEAVLLLKELASDLRIEGAMTSEVIERIYNYTGGHAYVMRVIVGEMAKEGKYTPPANLIGRRTDIVDAVFERSFNKLSDAGKSVFLLISNWKAEVPELGILVVLGMRGLDAEGGIDECRRLSLIFETELSSGQHGFSAPELARVYGRKKLQGDPDRLVIQADLLTLQSFGVANRHTGDDQSAESLVDRFVRGCFESAAKDQESISRSDKMLEALAVLWPSAWSRLAEFRDLYGSDNQEVAYAFRRAVEEQPFSKKAWLQRAHYAAKMHDDATRISSLLSAVDADPEDVSLVRDAALELCKYINNHKYEIPRTRRGVYIASLRAHMERLTSRLDATGFSRLAWLFPGTVFPQIFSGKSWRFDTIPIKCPTHSSLNRPHLRHPLSSSSRCSMRPMDGYWAFCASCWATMRTPRTFSSERV